MTKKNSTLKKDRIIKESIRSRYGKQKRGRRYSHLSNEELDKGYAKVFKEEVIKDDVEKEGIKNG